MNKPLSGIQLAQTIEQLKQQMPLIISSQAMKAEMYFTYYKQLVKEGFSEEQALEIIKARGLD